MNAPAWVSYVLLGFVVVYFIGWAYDKFLTKKVARLTAQRDALVAARPASTTPRISKPPEPINRNEFLQARIAYLAWMKAGIEFTVEKVQEVTVDGEVRKIRTTEKIIRPVTPKEMIEFVNIRDEEHVFQLLETWNQALQKTTQ